MQIALVLAYDGTAYHGYQMQSPNLPTIQSELERALSAVTGHSIATNASGRTDAGVHARGQVVAFVCPVSIPVDRIPYAVNARLPRDIRVLKAAQVPDSFHPRFDAVSKTYCYQVDISKTGNVFNRYTAYHFPYPIRLEPLIEALPVLQGTHDFTSFCAAATPVQNRVRTLYRVELEHLQEEQLLRFWITGSGFLWNMVRILVGTLLDVAKGRFQAKELAVILQACDRKRAGHTAPANGLTLWNVTYPDQLVTKQLFDA